jgi:hypothetical protein
MHRLGVLPSILKKKIELETKLPLTHNSNSDGNNRNEGSRLWFKVLRVVGAKKSRESTTRAITKPKRGED